MAEEIQKTAAPDTESGQGGADVKKNSGNVIGCFPAALVAVIVHILARLLDSQTPLQFAVLAFFIVIGLLAFIQARSGIREEKHAFEENRRLELNPDTIKHLVEQYPSDPMGRAADEVFKDKGGVKEMGIGIRWHHRERLRNIISAAFPQGSHTGHLPSLNNLRVLAAAAEMSRQPAWILKSIAATLLIVGIMGTLYGVHQALPVEAGVRIDMLQVRAALLPSAIAVGGTILFTLLRGWYLRDVAEHLGRLDRHTLRFYFPMFRTGSLDESRYQELGKYVADLNSSLDDISRTVDALSASRMQGLSIRDFPVPSVKLDKLASQMLTAGHTSAQLAELEGSLLFQADAVNQWYQVLSEQILHLSAQVQACASYIEKGARLCAGANTDLNSVQEQWQIVPAILNRRMMEADELSSIQADVSESHHVKRIEDAVKELNSMQANVVDQSCDSATMTAEVSYLMEQLSESIRNDEKQYRTYHEKLSSCYSRSESAMQVLSLEVEENQKSLREMHELLKKKEAPLVWNEILVVVMVVVLFVVNLWITLAIFV